MAFDSAGHLAWNLDAVHIGNGLVHSREVFVHDGFTALAVGLLNGMLNRGDGFVPGQNLADSEETGLHDGVDALPHAGLFRHGIGIDDIELNFLLNQVALHLLRQRVPDFFGAVDAVQEKYRTLAGVLQHIEAVHKTDLMAAHKGRFAFRKSGKAL